ncbi:MAG: serine hydroxymethyltransferase, partial [Candidatus Harrisonbacteria bacterium]|nr:serine hydroxymethyltransferase [Candidatus Harrisonbacteria bacterium]
LADISHISGLVAAGIHPSPFPHADVVMTTTHKTLRGPRGAVIFSRCSTEPEKNLSAKIDKAVFPGLQGGPHNNVTAAKAVAFFEALQPSFKKYQQQIVKNAKALAKEFIARGFPLLSGGTDTHLMLLDMRRFNIDGKSAEERLELAGIVANRNSLPGDDKPLKPSGVRVGTPPVTTRGMKEKEMFRIAEFFERLFVRGENPASVKKDVEKLCKKFPLPYK